MIRIGFYSGSFDPPTNGHVEIIARAAKLVDQLVVGVGAHYGKTPMFTLDERVAMLEEIAGKGDGRGFEIVTYDGLTVDAARKAGATLIVRGLRDAADLAYETQMAGMNAALAPTVETVFLMASPETCHIAASLVRQIAAMGGDVTAFVPLSVAARIAARQRLPEVS